jgi:protein-S-isoprenylcysteine O-methyltransferase Ste14
MDTATIYGAALAIAAAGAMARTILVALGWGRMLYRRSDFKVLRFGAIEAFNFPEPLLLGVAAFALFSVPAPSQVGTLQVFAAVGGAGLVTAGWIIIVAAFAAWPGMFAGHAIPKGHRLLTEGILGVVRHPAYAGAILVWAGLGIAHRSPLVCALTLVYVLPCYLLYIRSEEAMMRQEFGPAYDIYRQDVPMLWPRLWRPRGGRRPLGEDGRTT